MSAALAQTAERNYAEIIVDSARLEAFVAELRAENLKSDLSPAKEKDRKEIKSRNYTVARAKTSLDDAGKVMGEEYRTKLDAVNKLRRDAVKMCEALQADIMKPVTEWEAQEKARVESVQAVLARIEALQVVDLSMKSDEVKARIAELERMEIEHSMFQEMWDSAVTSRDRGVSMLTAAVARLKQMEDQNAELERLRADAALREKADAERAAAAEAQRQREESERLAAEAEAERQRVEAQRKEDARKQAAEAAERAAAEAKAAAERQAAEAIEAEKRRAEAALAEQQRQHQEELARLQRERDEKEAEERREREAAEERARAQREEEARRHADAEHRARIHREAADALWKAAKLDTFTAQLVIDAIADGRVPHVTIQF
jgi:colicin import membrane protein